MILARRNLPAILDGEMGAAAFIPHPGGVQPSAPYFVY